MPNALRAAVALVLAFLATAASGAPAGEGALPPPPANQADWTGKWKLDEKASDGIDPMLEIMEVPWYLSTLAKTFTPTFVVAPDGSGFDWSSETPLGSRTQHFKADGVVYPGEDQLERKFTQSSRWTTGGQLVVDRTTELPSGKKIGVRSTWTLDGHTLTNQMKVTPPGGAPFDLRRVFGRETS